jgi:hypothetical protein
MMMPSAPLETDKIVVQDDDEEGLNEEEAAEADIATPKDAKSPVSWVFHRLSYMARRRGAFAIWEGLITFVEHLISSDFVSGSAGDQRRCVVFRFFAAVSTMESSELVERFLPHMINPLFRATTLPSSKSPFLILWVCVDHA